MELIQTINGGIMTVDEAKNWFGVGKILTRYGVWAVTANGIECLATNYQIDKDALLGQNWLLHMCEKGWVDMRDFTQCFYAALDIHVNDSVGSR